MASVITYVYRCSWNRDSLSGANCALADTPLAVRSFTHKILALNRREKQQGSTSGKHGEAQIISEIMLEIGC